MNKHITVVSLVSLVALGVSGCKSQSQTQNPPPAVTEMAYTKQIPADQLPADVIKSVKQHVLRPQIINADTIMWKGAMAYKVRVLSGNTVYILKIRPDGLYLETTVDMH